MPPVDPKDELPMLLKMTAFAEGGEMGALLDEAAEKILSLHLEVARWERDAKFVQSKMEDGRWRRMVALEKFTKRYREALVSISKNTCCDSCQEARLVALKALQVDL